METIYIVAAIVLLLLIGGFWYYKKENFDEAHLMAEGQIWAREHPDDISLG